MREEDGWVRGTGCFSVGGAGGACCADGGKLEAVCRVGLLCRWPWCVGVKATRCCVSWRSGCVLRWRSGCGAEEVQMGEEAGCPGTYKKTPRPSSPGVGFFSDF